MSNVPVCVPAFHDSEIGNDLITINHQRKQKGLPRIVVDHELDTWCLAKIALAAKRMAIFSIGGGTPCNNTQNVCPFIEIASNRLGIDWPPKMFDSGCRIDRLKKNMTIISLGTATYSEAASWRKTKYSKQAFAELGGDATIFWPFLQAAVGQRLGWYAAG